MPKKTVILALVTLFICQALHAQEAVDKERWARTAKQLEESKQWVDREITDFGEESSLTVDQKRAFYDYFDGVKFLRDGDYYAALDSFKLSLERDPSCEWYLLVYGNATGSGREDVIEGMLAGYCGLKDSESALKFIEHELEQGNDYYHGFYDKLEELVKENYPSTEGQIQYYKQKIQEGYDVFKPDLVNRLLSAQTDLYYKIMPPDESDEINGDIHGIPYDYLLEAWNIIKQDLKDHSNRFDMYLENINVLQYLGYYRNASLEQMLKEELASNNLFAGLYAALSLVEMDQKGGIEFLINHLKSKEEVSKAPVREPTEVDKEGFNLLKENPLESQDDRIAMYFPEADLSRKCLEYLKKYTKKDFGYNREQWRQWWETEGKFHWTVKWSQDIQSGYVVKKPSLKAEKMLSENAKKETAPPISPEQHSPEQQKEDPSFSVEGTHIAVLLILASTFVFILLYARRKKRV